jgi:ribosomal protein S18 acetylase RimI-like enzyme
MICSNLPSELREALQHKPLHSLNMLGFFEHNHPDKIIRINKSFMASGKSDEQWWYIWCDSLEDFSRFLNQLEKGEHHLAVVADWMMNEVETQFDVEWVLSCVRLYLPSHVILPGKMLKLTELAPNDTECIFSNSNYKSFTSPEYISHQLSIRPGIAYRNGNTLWGWVMFHDDGAMGLLHVLDDYRRMGIAKGLMVELCKRIRENGKTPYTSVEPGNTASMELVKSLGFVEVDNIHWVKFHK